MEQNHIVYNIPFGDKTYEVVELEAGLLYGVTSRTRQYMYRNVSVSVGRDDIIVMECDCESGYYRGPNRLCFHKKLIMPLVQAYYSDKAESEESEYTSYEADIISIFTD